MIEREISIPFEGKKFSIKFPNVGQMIDIESLKSSLSGNKYGSFAASGIKTMYFALDMIDAISFFSVMCPKLKDFITEEDNVDYTQMKPESVKELVTLYQKFVLPWYSKILEQLYSSSNESIETETKRVTSENN